MNEGGCLCGRVRYQAEGFSEIFKCHCSNCRKAFGSAASAGALVSRDSFQWLQGEDAIRLFEKTPTFRRYFCEDCGSILPQFVDGMGQWWIPMGTLEGDPGVSVGAHLYVDSMACWDVIEDGLPRFSESFD